MSGYHFLFVPGPSNVPAAVQQAIHCLMEEHRNPTIPDLIQPITQDLKKILRTESGKVVCVVGAWLVCGWCVVGVWLVCA